MTQCADVPERRVSEDTLRDPRGVVHHIALLSESVASAAGLQVVSVEADDAAIVWVAANKQKGVGKQERRYVAGANVSGILGGTDRRGDVLRRRWEQPVD